jgi:hypothetical protein
MNVHDRWSVGRNGYRASVLESTAPQGQIGDMALGRVETRMCNQIAPKGSTDKEEKKEGKKRHLLKPCAIASNMHR